MTSVSEDEWSCRNVPDWCRKWWRHQKSLTTVKNYKFLLATSKSLLNAAVLRLQGHGLKSSGLPQWAGKQVSIVKGCRLFCQDTKTFTKHVTTIKRESCFEANLQTRRTCCGAGDHVFVVVTCFVNGRSITRVLSK